MSAHPFTIAQLDDCASDALLTLSIPPRTRWSAALIATPDRCYLARVADDAFEIVLDDSRQARILPAAEVTDVLARAYEIRLFGPDAELRWTRNGLTGAPTLIADGKITHPGSELRSALEVLERRYRIWGERSKAQMPKQDHWTALAAGRIGTIWVPFADDATEGVVLTAKEYVERGKGGNAVVTCERLVGFAAAPPPSKG